MSSLLFVCRSDEHGQQIAKSIDGHMGLGTLLSLIAIIARSPSTFGHRLDGSTVNDHGRRLSRTPAAEPEEFAQIVRQGLEDTGFHPASRLLIDRVVRRKVGRRIAPLTPCLDQVTQRIENASQAVFTLRRIQFHQREIRSAEFPLLVGHVAGIVGGIGLDLCHPKGSTPSVQ